VDDADRGRPSSRTRGRCAQRVGDGVVWVGARHDARQVPGAEADHGDAELEREGDLGQRSVLAPHRDDGLGGADDEDVARLAEAGGQRERDVLVRRGAVAARQKPDDERAALSRPASGGSHDAPEAARDDDGPGAGEGGAHGLRRLLLVGGRVARADDGDDGCTGHASTLPVMEVMLRCAVPDRPGALAALAHAIAEAGGDIQAVDVVETRDGVALDDLVVVIDPALGRRLADCVRAVEGVELVHAGPSRGDPGGAVFRLAVGLEALLSGAMTVEHGLRALLGGLLRASSAELVDRADAPPAGARILVLDAGASALVLRRDYRFTATERDRAAAVLRACLRAASAMGKP
jgi:hypothetical protein